MSKLEISEDVSWDVRLQRCVDSGIIPGVLNRVLLPGFFRAGKTRFARDLFGAENVEETTFHKQVVVDDILGSYAPNDGAPGMHWVDGPVARAMRHGRKLVINECSHFSGDVRCALHAILDDPAGIALPNGEFLKAAPGYAVIGTMNESPETLPPGIYDRFDCIYRVDSLSQGLRNALGNFADKAQNVAHRGVDWQWTRPASVNLFLAAAKLRRHGLSDAL